MGLCGTENNNNDMSQNIQIWYSSQSRENYLSNLNGALITPAFYWWIQLLTGKVRKKN